MDVLALNDQIDEILISFDSYDEMKEYFIDTLKRHLDTGDTASSGRDFELFDQIKALVLKDLAHNYSLQEICTIFRVSQPYVRKIFNTHTGKSYNDFILEEKIKYAVEMITENPNIQVKKLASMLGYE